MATVARWVLRLLTAALLSIDAYVHADLAVRYDPNVAGGLSQGDLFRIEAGVSALAAMLVLVMPRRATWAFAFGVAASAFGAVMLYRYVDVGSLGPLPSMYEPAWYTEKTVATIAEGLAAVTALAGFLTHPKVVRGPHRRDSSTSPSQRSYRADTNQRLSDASSTEGERSNAAET